MKIIVTSFKRSQARTAALGASDPAAGHCGATPPLETPGCSQEILGQSLPSENFQKSLILIHQRPDRLRTTITEN